LLPLGPDGLLRWLTAEEAAMSSERPRTDARPISRRLYWDPAPARRL